MERFTDLNNRLEQLVVPIGEGDVPGKRRSVKSWKEVEIKEPDKPEPLVDLARDERLKPYLILSPQYHQQKIEGSIEKMWVRESVADALYRAAQLLPEGCKFEIWDAWRPFVVQQALFNEYLESLKEKKPELSEKELNEEAQKYVSLPSKDLERPSPHNTGGAIDLTIVGPDGEKLEMGTEFDYFGPEAKTIYFEEKLKDSEVAPSERERQILKNRRLLFSIMITAGFSNYEEEWWHYDLGNQFWGRIKGKTAIYGRAVPAKWINPDEKYRFTPPPPRKST